MCIRDSSKDAHGGYYTQDDIRELVAYAQERFMTVIPEIEIRSRFKINVFHWHLTENQAWRLESKIFPMLNDSCLLYTSRCV